MTSSTQATRKADLSVILPCYNAATLIESSLAALRGYLESLTESLALTWEIVVVDDGSTDATAALLDRLAAPEIRPVRLARNSGKGRAVSAGMAQATGRYRIFTDADLPYRLESIAPCVDKLAAGHHAVFGNRRLAASTTETRLPPLRRAASNAFRLAAGLVIGRHDLDTQCGFKGFSGPLADRLFPMLTIDRFAFDVELCLLLVEAGIEIGFVPVRLVNQEQSTVTLVGTGAQAVMEIGRIALRRMLRRYNVGRLRPFSVPAA